MVESDKKKNKQRDEQQQQQQQQLDLLAFSISQVRSVVGRRSSMDCQQYAQPIASHAQLIETCLTHADQDRKKYHRTLESLAQILTDQPALTDSEISDEEREIASFLRQKAKRDILTHTTDAMWETYRQLSSRRGSALTPQIQPTTTTTTHCRNSIQRGSCSRTSPREEQLASSRCDPLRSDAYQYTTSQNNDNDEEEEEENAETTPGSPSRCSGVGSSTFTSSSSSHARSSINVFPCAPPQSPPQLHVTSTSKMPASAPTFALAAAAAIHINSDIIAAIKTARAALSLLAGSAAPQASKTTTTTTTPAAAAAARATTHHDQPRYPTTTRNPSTRALSNAGSVGSCKKASS